MADQVLAALQEATRVMTQVAGRLDSLEETTDERLVDLKDHLTSRVDRLDAQMGTTNAHLDNIAREASITNDLLRTDQDERKDERARQERLEDEERARQERLEDETREDERKAKRDLQEAAVSAAKEAWSIFKQPLGYLVAAALGFVSWQYFTQNMPQQVAPVPPGVQVEGHG